MSVTKISLALLASTIVAGLDNKYLLPQHNADKVSGEEEKVIYGDLAELMQSEAGLALLGDPAVLPEPDKKGVKLINGLLQFTARVMAEAVENGFQPSEDWNKSVEELGEWLKVEESIAEAVVETPEQEAAPLTEAQAEAVAEAVAEEPEAVEAARELVTATVGEVVAGNMSDDQIVQTALGLGLLNAQEAAVALNDSAVADIQDATTVFIAAMTSALQKMGASSAIQHSTIASIKAALPAEVEV